MKKIKFDRICPVYDDYCYTVYDLNHNVLYNDAANLVEQLKKQNRNTDGLLIVTKNLREAYPKPSACIPFKIHDFLSYQPRGKR